MRRRSPLVLTASMALLASIALAACGDDDDDATATTTAPTAPKSSSTEATETSSTAGADSSTASSTGGEVASREEYVETTAEEISDEFGDLADCGAEALINDDVYAAIQAAGLTLEQFQENGPEGITVDAAVAESVGADLAACGDVLGQVIPSDEEEALACAEQHIDNEQAAAAIAFDVLGAEPSSELQAALDEFDACLAETTTTTS